MAPRLLPIAWGLTWRWSILFISLIAPAPPAAILGTGLLLVVGLIASLWRRIGLLGSAWRLLLAVSIVNLGFWLGSPLLVPAITLALGVTVLDTWWSIRGGARTAAQPAIWEEPVTALVPYESLEPVRQVERSGRGETAGGFRFLATASLVLVVVTVGAFALASGASPRFSSAIAAIGQNSAPLTANGNDWQPSLGSIPRIELPNLCVSLPDHRYELRLPNGQVIVIATKHRDGCPDLSTILKALQNAGGSPD